MKQRSIKLLFVMLSMMGIQTSALGANIHFADAALKADYQATNEIAELVPNAPGIPTDGLVAYYPFNGIANDESGNGNDGILSGNNVPVLTTDRFGKANSAYEFGGYYNPNWIRVPSSESLAFDDKMTISLWVQQSEQAGMNGWGSYSDASNTERLPGFTVIGKAGDTRGFWINTGVPQNGVGMTVSTGNKNNGVTNYDYRFENHDYQLGDWLHVALVVDGKEKILYLDGVEVARDELNLDANFTVANSQDMYIGIMCTTSPRWYPFNGKIDDIRIYNRALTPSEINVLFKENVEVAQDDNTPKSPRYLVVWDNNDAKTTYALKDKPQVTLADDAFVVTKDGQETSFPMGSTKRFTYERIMPGDINGDAKVDIVDVAMTINYLLSVTRSEFPVEAADLNKNGGVDSDDVTAMIDLVMNGPEAVAPAPVQQSRGNALYNYRNDGDFNAWLNIDVDSITYSRFDLDGIECDNVVTQEVWTPDSCFRIPIEAIDSIGFRAPKPIMKDGLFYLRDYHASLTNSIDSLTIYFDKSILPDSLPSIGQVVLNATYTSPYEGGFAGRVKSIEQNDASVIMECEMIAVGDVYKRLVLVGKAITDSERGASSRRRVASDPWIDFEDKDIKVIDSIGDFTFSCLNGILSVVSKDPTAVVSYYVYIDEFYYSMYAQMNLIHHDLQTHVNISLAKIESLNNETKDILKALTSVDNLDSWLEGKLNGAEDKKDEPGEIDLLNYLWKNHKLKNKAPIPIAGPLVLDYEFAPMLKLKGDLELDWAFKTKALNTFYVKACGYTAAAATNPQLSLLTGLAKVEGSSSFSSDPISDQQIDFRAKGSLTTGFSGKVTISLINKNVVHATVSAQGGLKNSGQLNLKLMDTSTDDADETIYEATKDTKFKTELFAKAGVNFGATPAKLLSIGEEWEVYTKDLGTTYLFPHFSQPTLPTYDKEKDQWSNGNSNNHVVLESSPSKNIPDLLLGPCKIGLKIIDENGVCVRETDEREYKDDGTIVWGLYPLSIDLTGLTPGNTYRCYPVLRYHNWWQLRATPSYEFTMPEPMTIGLDTPLNSVTLKKGQELHVAINGGWGDYSASSSVDAVCTAEIINNNDKPYVKLGASKLMAGSATVTVKDLRAGTTETILVTVAGELQPVTSITLSQTTLNLQEGGTQSLTATVLPEDADNRTVAWESSDEGVATVTADGLVTAVAKGSCVITCSATDGSDVKAEVQVTVTSGTIPDPGNHEWVDLGLPSGTLWATCNVGASSPEEYGLYFAWGETQGYTGDTSDGRSFNWANYKWCNGSYNSMTKYCIHSNYGNNGFTDGLTELLPEDDAATANWGSGWRMPTIAQIEELINSEYTTTEWTTQNGVNGRKITSKRNGSSIFLPAAGYRFAASLDYAGSYGYYWSRSLYTSYSEYARNLGFYSGGIYAGYNSRYYGRSVRPVRAQN